MGAGTTLGPVIADDGSIRTTDKRLLPNQLELRGGVRPMNFFINTIAAPSLGK